MLSVFLSPLNARIYTFNDPSEYDAFYITGTNLWTKTATGGISDSRWYTFTAPNNTVPGMLVLNTPFSGDQDQLTLGINFLWRGTTTSGQEIFSLGIGRAADAETKYVPRNSGTEVLGPATNQQLHLGLSLRAGEPRVVQVKGLSIVDGKRSYLNDKSGNTAGLTDDNWYYMEVTFNKSAIQTGYDVVLSLFESQEDGTRGDAPILSWQTTQYNAALKEGNVYAFVSGVSLMHSNIVGVDNFYVSIPEGDTVALFVGGSALLAVALYRTRMKSAQKAPMVHEAIH